MVAQIDSVYVRTRPTRLYSRLLSYALFEGRPLTTKGRWINPLVFSFFDVLKRLPSQHRVKKPIFIIGTGRSGTTILGIVLSMHRDIGFLNEPKALWHAIRKDEDLIGSYSRTEARYRLTNDDATTQVIKDAHRLYTGYLSATRNLRVVDKYPELIFRLPFVRALFPDAKFLFLARNGWDTCASIEHWSERLGIENNQEIHDWWGVNNRKWKLLVDQIVKYDPELGVHWEHIRAFTRHIDMAAVEWIVTMREGLKLRKEFPDSVHTIIYEELVKQPTAALTDVLNFCELPFDNVFVQYGIEVLKPVTAKSPCALDEKIHPAFYNMMNALGYHGNY